MFLVECFDCMYEYKADYFREIFLQFGFAQGIHNQNYLII